MWTLGGRPGVSQASFYRWLTPGVTVSAALRSRRLELVSAVFSEAHELPGADQIVDLLRRACKVICVKGLV